MDYSRLNPLLGRNVQHVQYVGKVRAQKLNKLGIKTIGDLITYYPRDYEDRTREKRVSELVNDDECAVILKVISDVSLNRPRRNLRIYKTVGTDDTGYVTLTWFNQDYVREKIFRDKTYVFFGRVKRTGIYIEIVNPVFEEVSSERKKTTGIQPVYALTAGITQTYLRMIQRNALDLVAGKLTEILPEELRREFSLAEINFTLENIHFPGSFEAKEKARKRLVFDELLMLQLGLLQLKSKQKAVTGIKMEKKPLVDRFINQLPFQLTRAQLRVYREIEEDMIVGEKQMNRLIQGDVGSGKTIVAVLAILLTVLNGYQAVFMVPTEILAEQHYQSINRLFRENEIGRAHV